MKFRYTHEWIIRQAKAKVEAKADWICYSTPGLTDCVSVYYLCVYSLCVCVASMCVSGESRKRAAVTRKPQQLKKQPFLFSQVESTRVESVGLPSCDCGLLLLLPMLLLLSSSEQQESASANRQRPTLIALIFGQNWSMAMDVSQIGSGICSCIWYLDFA